MRQPQTACHVIKAMMNSDRAADVMILLDEPWPNTLATEISVNTPVLSAGGGLTETDNPTE